MTVCSTRRAILAGAASLPALSVPALAGPALAAQPDPTFGAIEEWKRAYAFYGECLDQASAIEDLVTEKRNELLTDLETRKDEVIAEAMALFPGRSADSYWKIVGAAADKIAKDENDNGKSEELRERGIIAEIEARTKLFETVPTSKAGAIAFISLLLDDYHENAVPYFEHDDAIAALKCLEEMLA